MRVLREAPDVADYTIKWQVVFLLQTPLYPISVNQQHTRVTRPPLVLAIDALNECADAEEVKQLLPYLTIVFSSSTVYFSFRPFFHRGCARLTITAAFGLQSYLLE